MKNPLQLAINAVLLVAVAVLYFLHFSARPAGPAPAAPVAAVAAAPADTATATPAAEAAPEATPEAAAPATAAAPVPAGAIVYVESSRLLDGYQGMKDARKAFEAKAQGWERQNQALVGSFRTAVEQYQKSAASLTPEQRAATEAKLQEQQQRGAVEQQKIQAQAQEAEAKLSQTVLGGVRKKVEAYGKSHGYKLILIDSSGSTIAYGENNLDITGPVLTYLNATYKH